MKYHSTMKALIMAQQEGALPEGAVFEEASLVRDTHAHIIGHRPTGPVITNIMPCIVQGEYWAAHCDFSSFLQPEPPFISALEELEALGLKLCIFTNGPRAYALKVLERLEVKRFFADEHIFAVEDVLPACKPEAAAFNKVRTTPRASFPWPNPVSIAVCLYGQVIPSFLTGVGRSWVSRRTICDVRGQHEEHSRLQGPRHGHGIADGWG